MARKKPKITDGFSGDTGHKTRAAIHCLLLAALAIAVYIHTLDFPFVFDDESYIVEDPVIRGWSYFTDSSKIDSMRVYDIKGFFRTRYVGYLSFALNYNAHGLDVRGFRAVNILIHIINGMLLYAFVLMMLKTPKIKGAFDGRASGWTAFVIAAMFIAHPLNTQAVTYISQRFTSLCAMFYLSGMAMYAKWRGNDERSRFKMLWYAGAVASSVVAMQTKEIAFTLPVMIGMFEFMFYDGPAKKRIIWLSPFMMTMAIIPLLLVFRAEGSAMSAMGMAAKGEMAARDYLLTQFSVVATYLRLLILPMGQNLDYDYPIYTEFFSAPVIMPLMLHMIIIGIGAWLFVRSRVDAWLRPAAFGIFWFYLALSVESSILPIKDVIFEHRVYLPGIGIIAAAVVLGSVLAQRWKISGRMAVFIAICVVLALSMAAFARNRVWRDAVALWSDAALKSPMKARPHMNLGSQYIGKKQYDLAIEEFNKVLTLGGGLEKVSHFDMGVAHLEKGAYEKARQAWLKAVELDPGYPEALNNLGNLALRSRDVKTAGGYYMRAYESDPTYPDVIFNLAVYYEAIGQNQKAIEFYEEYLKTELPDKGHEKTAIESIKALKSNLNPQHKKN